jgi:Zn-dependent peptidase ImmA (M78 family)
MNHQTNDQSRSVLRELRALMPERVLSYPEALQRAELQAGRLLSLHGLTKGAVPTEIITELPRIRTDREWDMPASGSAHWDGSAWVITLNAAEHELRQRFSTFHEFKHILDHPTRHLIEGDRQYRLTAAQMAEKVADYFAACVLMPRAWVKSAFCTHTQSTEALASEFNVSAKAMSVRLAQLGLSTPVDRCAHNHQAGAYRRRGHYFRQLPARPLLEGVAA